MKILTTIEREVEVSLSFPIFFKTYGDSLYKVIDEKTYVNVFLGSTFSTVNLSNKNNDWYKYYEKSTPITESDFNAAVVDALSVIADANIKQMEAAA